MPTLPESMIKKFYDEKKSRFTKEIKNGFIEGIKQSKRESDPGSMIEINSLIGHKSPRYFNLN